MLPRELGCSGLTCWRRWRDWQEAGVRAGLHRVLLERLSKAAPLDWSRASLDSVMPAASLIRRARRATLDAVRPRRRFGTLHGDAAYDPRRGQAECPSECRARSIRPRTARRGMEMSEKPSQPRGGVEKPLAGLCRFRRLAIRLTNAAPPSPTPS